jgi:hypothetical protein
MRRVRSSRLLASAVSSARSLSMHRFYPGAMGTGYGDVSPRR